MEPPHTANRCNDCNYLGIKYIVIKMNDTGAPRNLWLVLWKTSRAVEEHARRQIEGLNLGPSDFGILEVLMRQGPLAVSVLGRHVLLTSGSISTAIDRLEERDLVRRKESPADRRARTVHLTPEGRALIRKAYGQHERAIERAISSLSAPEQREAIRLLTKLGAGAVAALDAGQEAR